MRPVYAMHLGCAIHHRRAHGKRRVREALDDVRSYEQHELVRGGIFRPAHGLLTTAIALVRYLPDGEPSGLYLDHDDAGQAWLHCECGAVPAPLVVLRWQEAQEAALP